MGIKEVLYYLETLKKYNVYVNGSLVRVKSDEIADFIGQQDKYAELGRLALTTRANVCSNNDFIKMGAKCCKKHCTNYLFCQKRAELLSGEK